MSRFEETVAKIAASPVKRALFKEVPSVLLKNAGVLDSLLRQEYKGPLGQALTGLTTGAALGGGTYLTGKLLDRWDESGSRLDAERRQLGQLSGEQRFRGEALKKLMPMHGQTFEALQADPIIAKADPQLISSSFETMKRFAPYLATDPNAARSFLRETAMYGTGPSYASLKNLADAEQSVNRAGRY